MAKTITILELIFILIMNVLSAITKRTVVQCTVRHKVTPLTEEK